MSLDKKLDTWEDRVSIYGAYLVHNGIQSSTLKSYVSAIKCVLCLDNYEWQDNKVLLNTLTGACRVVNDKVMTRLPIKIGFLEILLFETDRIFAKQPFLELLYKTVFAICYYGLLQVGEVARSPHAIKAKNVHIGQNKCKILLILYSSKTHGAETYPQKVKISAMNDSTQFALKRNFCPFKLMRQYMTIRGNYKNDDEQFFVFSDCSPLLPT